MTNDGTKIQLEVESRDSTGKNVCRRLRAKGLIPGNVYGLDRPPFMVAVNPKRIDELLRLGSGVNTIFTLTLTDQPGQREAMIKELQRDPVTERPIHIDFFRVDPNRAVQVAIPIHLEGTPDGVKNEGGVIDFVHREALVECLPADIPEHLDVDVSALHINQHVALKDLVMTERVTLIEDPEQIIAVVVAPRVEEVAAVGEEEEAAEGAEPEVEAKGKEGEAGEESADKES